MAPGIILRALSESVAMNLPGFPRRSFGSGLRLFCLAAAVLLACQPARAEKRVALVLGNSAYQNVTPLPNPVNDGAMIANMLEGAGFDIVDSRHDLTAADTRRVLRDFADRAARRRHRRDLLRRSRHGGRWQELPDPGGRQTGARHRRLRRGRVARPHIAGGRARKAASAGHPRRLPGQSLCQDHEADHCLAFDRIGAWPRSSRPARIR